MGAIALLASVASAYDLQLASEADPLTVYGYLHLEQSLLAIDGNETQAAEGLFLWDDGYDYDVRSSVLLGGHITNSLTLNGTFLYDSRYEETPYRAWDRDYWDHFRMRLDLDTEHPFWDEWSLKGSVDLNRDPNWRQRFPDSRLLMEPVEELRLEAGFELRGPWAVVQGGDLKTQLGPSDLLLYERNAVGLHGTLLGENSQAEIVAAREKGEVFYQAPSDSLGIPADGTAGPYRLAHSPIVRGSDEVWIEVRDRFDPTIVRERRPQRRLIDYTLDYVRGVLVFQEPISSETFEDHPVFIAVQYSYDSRDFGYDRYLGATRGEAELADQVRFGVTYAGEFDDAGSWDGTLEGRPGAERHHVYGFDAAVDLAEQTSITAVYAASDSGSWGRGDESEAIQLSLDSRSLDRLTVSGDYRRIEHEFEPIANRFLVGQQDKERWELSADLEASESVDVRLGHRTSRDLRSTSDGAQSEDRSFLAGAAWGYSSRGRVATEFEVRDRFDRNDRSRRDERRSTLRVDASVGGSFLDLETRYENERFDDHRDSSSGNPGEVPGDLANGSARETIHRIKFAPTANLGRGLSLHGEAKNELVRDRTAAEFVRRRAFAGTELRYQSRAKGISTLVSWEGRFEYALSGPDLQLLGGDPMRAEQAVSVGADWRPHERWDTHARLEHQEERDEVTDAAVRRTRSYRHDLTHAPTRDLRLHAGIEMTDLEDLRKIGVAGSGNRRKDTELLFDGSYNYREDLSLTGGVHLQRREVFDPDVQETWVRRIFAGANGHLHRRVEATLEVHYAWLDGKPLTEGIETIENTRLRLLGEVSWDVRSWMRLALGHEQVDYQEDSTGDGANDFEAGRTYLKWIARL